MTHRETRAERINRRFSTKKVRCPRCGARPGRDCISSRIPSANSFGGGWGGYPTLDRSHSERVSEARSEREKRLDALNLRRTP